MYSPDSVMDVLEAGSVGHGQQSKTKCLIQHGFDKINVLNSHELLHMTFI